MSENTIYNNTIYNNTIYNRSPFTCVSGFWQVKNKHDNKFLEWFKTSLLINCPYVFFTDKEGIDLIKRYRKSLPTYYIECQIEDFHTYQYKDKITTHPVHCPSKELNLIWNEKIFLMEKAKNINPFNSEFFCWVDAGICTYRTVAPPPQSFPDLNKLRLLPKDRFIYSVSTPWNPTLVTTNNYYHHISGTYILHKNIISRFTEMYKLFLAKIFNDTNINKSNIWTDQVILTHMFKTFPDKFYKLCEGYGTLFNVLY
uniref:Nucleotide-diphospho-sugar transferase domain-containing protein n=1 Tax=viral metagenome TaxID=1070528 RepID=A0A6C0IMM7_9ZZZZ